MRKQRGIVIDLSGAHLQYADVSGSFQRAVLSSANLDSAHLHEIDLQGADLTNAVLKDATFDEANLRGAVFRCADAGWGTTFNCDLTGAILDSVSWDATTKWPPDFRPLPNPRPRILALEAGDSLKLWVDGLLPESMVFLTVVDKSGYSHGFSREHTVIPETLQEQPIGAAIISSAEIVVHGITRELFEDRGMDNVSIYIQNPHPCSGSRGGQSDRYHVDARQLDELLSHLDGVS
jgi:hypothetical protein